MSKTQKLDGVVRKQPQPTPEPVEMSRFRKLLTIAILSLALAIIIIDTTLLNVSLATIIKDLNTDIQGLQWVITSYALTLAALTITGGRFGDLYGRKKMFVLGAIIFAAGSFLASISTNLGMLLAGESIIEGIGAALMMPATASLLLATFRGRARALAFGIWGAIAAASSAIGPLLGGYLTTNYSWRWGFRINIVVAAILVAGSLLIKDSRDREEKPELDILGVFLSATSLLAIVFGIIQSSTFGWFKATAPYAVFGRSLGTYSVTFWSLLVGFVLFVAFLFWQQLREKRGQTPLVSLGLFRIRQFMSGTVTTMVMSMGMVGLIFAVPVFLQSVRGLDAFHTGLALLPMSGMMLIVGPLSALASKHIPAKYLIQAGLLLDVIAAFVLRQSLNLESTGLSLAPGLLIYGMGMGLVMAQISNLTLSGVSVDQAGEASGVNNTLRQVGSSLGTAVIGAVMLSTLSSHMINAINASAKIPAQAKPLIVQAVTQQSSSIAFGGVKGDSRLSAPVQAELTTIAHEAVLEGGRQALIYAALFAGLGFLLSFLLPAHKELDRHPMPAKAGH
jgi:EmrB/QacA subfamily drug resistance transporter